MNTRGCARIFLQANQRGKARQVEFVIFFTSVPDRRPKRRWQERRANGEDKTATTRRILRRVESEKWFSKIGLKKTVSLLDEACRSKHISRPFLFESVRRCVLKLWSNRKHESVFPKPARKNPAKQLPKSQTIPRTNLNRKAGRFRPHLPQLRPNCQESAKFRPG